LCESSSVNINQGFIMSIIAVFPGQGSQVIGMGMEIAKKFKSAQLVLMKLIVH